MDKAIVCLLLLISFSLLQPVRGYRQHLLTSASTPNSEEHDVRHQLQEKAWINLNESENYGGRHECSFVQAGNKFYLFGGRENAKRLDTYLYTNNTWTTSASAAREFNHFQATEYQGLIWVIGAFQTNNFPQETPDDTVRVYDPANNIWMDGPVIPIDRRRGSAGLAVYQDKFYIVAGSTNGHSGGYVDWFDEYDPRTNTWTVLTPAPHNRDHFHAVVLQETGKLYAIGGRLSGGIGGPFKPLIPEVDVYDFMTSKWSTLPQSANVPNPRAASAVALVDGKIMMMGGETAEQAWSLVEAFDPNSNTWSTLASMNYRRHGTQAIVSGDGVYITAGSPNPGGGAQKNMEVYGTNNAVGEQSTPGILTFTANTTSIRIPKGETVNTLLLHTSGNQGVFVTRLFVTNSLNFVISTGEMKLPFLILRDGSVKISMDYIGNCSNAYDSLYIVYSGSRTISLQLIGNYDVTSLNTGSCDISTISAKPVTSPLTTPVTPFAGNPPTNPILNLVLAKFTIVNAENDQDVGQLINGTTINLMEVRSLSIRADVNVSSVLSGQVEINQVQFYLDGVAYRTETKAPYTIAGDSNGDYFPWQPTIGDHIVSLVVTTNDGLSSSVPVQFQVVSSTLPIAAPSPIALPPTIPIAIPATIPLIPTIPIAGSVLIPSSPITPKSPPAPIPYSPTNPILTPVSIPSPPKVLSINLINAEDGKILLSLMNGTSFSLAGRSKLNINVVTDPYPIIDGYVEFLYDNGKLKRTEIFAPYALAGDNAGIYTAWKPTIGFHTLSVTPYQRKSNVGLIIGIGSTISFDVAP